LLMLSLLPFGVRLMAYYSGWTEQLQEVNKVVEFYVKLIRAGKKTIDQVPEKWREAVKIALEKG
ncbi:MAG: CD1375 family protein, partial [bacterium]